jgi:hypothetical protein
MMIPPYRESFGRMTLPAVAEAEAANRNSPIMLLTFIISNVNPIEHKEFYFFMKEFHFSVPRLRKTFASID